MSILDIEEAQKPIRESIEALTDPLLEKDHPMFDESIDYTREEIVRQSSEA